MTRPLVNVRLADDVTARLDAVAASRGLSRSDAIRARAVSGHAGAFPSDEQKGTIMDLIDTETSASRQHWIDTGSYLTVRETCELAAAELIAERGIEAHDIDTDADLASLLATL